MIDSREAETMDYLTYKRTVWSRLLAWWREYQPEHPERATFVQARIEVCEAQVARWGVSDA